MITWGKIITEAMNEAAHDLAKVEKAVMTTGSLELIIGCMFSGKSSELIRRIKHHKLIERKVLIINHSSDVRYDSNKVASHDKIIIDAISIEKLADLSPNKITSHDVICIDEGQFFTDLYENVVLLVEKYNKHVIVSGLDGTFERKPFYNMLQLIPFADDVVRLKAVCVDCKSGKSAIFSKRFSGDMQNEMLVGGSECYKAVCRECFHKP